MWNGCLPGRPAGCLVFAAALFAVARPAPGQTGAWSTAGPAGGSVYCIAADPSNPATLYAGTAQGVYKSADGGASWTAAGSGMPAVRVQTVAIDPTAPSTLYAGTLTPNGVESVGIFKSTDGAGSWIPINEGLVDTTIGVSPIDIEALAVDPRHPGTILAGGRYSDIFKSTDGGATWVAKTSGGFNALLETAAFQFDPSGSSNVYAASTAGFLRSTDGGETWSQYGNAGVSFFRIAVGAAAPSTLYAGDAGGSGIWKSTDGGAHWSRINNGLPVDSGSNPPIVTALAVDPSNSAAVLAGTYGSGFFQTSNGGTSWAAANSGVRDLYVAALALLPGQSPTVYAGTYGGGVYRSLDAARSWTPRSAGLNLARVFALAADPAAPRTLYAGTFDGVHKTANGGGAWQAAVTGLPVAPVLALAHRPGSPAALFAGTYGGGLWKSSDGGATWSSSAQGMADLYISSVAVDPTNPSTLYAGTTHPYDSGHPERLYKSTDGGASWTQTSLNASSFSVDFIAVNPAMPSQVVAGSRGVSGYFQSLDAGATWSTIVTDANCGGVNAVAFDPSAATIYVGGSSGLCTSTDAGKTWSPRLVAVLASVQAILLDPSSSSTIYAGAAPSVPGGTGGVLKSVDSGQTWRALGSGLDTASVNALVLDAAGQRLHAATDGGGVAELSLTPDRSPVASPAPSGRRPTLIAPR